MNRRRLLQLGATLFAAPAIVRAESLMRVCLVPVPAPKNRMVTTAEFYKAFADVINKNRLEYRLERLIIDRGDWHQSDTGGIIILKRPNYSETRLWPESE